MGLPVHLLSNLLDSLVQAAPGVVLRIPSQDASIGGIALDSRQVQAGDVFFALTGGAADGHRFIPDALQRGAVAVVGEQALEGLPAPYVQARNSREALAYLSAAFYGFPGRKLTVIGVTGTDGKTTTCNLIYQILQAAGLRTGMISTVNALIGEQVLDTGFHVTTPEAPDVQRYLAQMVEAGLIARCPGGYLARIGPAPRGLPANSTWEWSPTSPTNTWIITAVMRPTGLPRGCSFRHWRRTAPKASHPVHAASAEPG